MTMKAFKTTWIGDEDPSAQIILIDNLRFIKGDAREVPEDHPLGEVIYGNPLFVHELEEVAEVEDTTSTNERGLVRAELEALGIEFDGRLGIDALKALLPS